ncbi:MAG: hypothetical protein ACYS74_07620 [Planctomycetota bacterium]|jgi:hypothetical protein
MGILRKIKKMVVSRNPQDSTVDSLNSNDEIHNLSDVDGSLESVYVEEQNSQACGCFGPPGGRCSECGAISCIRCHQHCGGSDTPNPLGCGRPLCREHSYYLVLQDGPTVPFCRQCYGKITRKGRWQLAGRLLLEPFVEKGSDYE